MFKFLSCYLPFAIETKQNDTNVICFKQGKSTTSVHQKPTFNGVYTHNTYKIDICYILVKRCFWMCSNWSMAHLHLTFLRETFQKNGYAENLIDRCFKLFLKKNLTLKEKEAFAIGLSLFINYVIAN